MPDEESNANHDSRLNSKTLQDAMPENTDVEMKGTENVVQPKPLNPLMQAAMLR